MTQKVLRQCGPNIGEVQKDLGTNVGGGTCESPRLGVVDSIVMRFIYDDQNATKP